MPWNRQRLEVVVGPFEMVAVLGVTGIFFGSMTKIITAMTNRRGTVAPAQLDMLDQRLTRIEQAIDAMAVEVERISEGQRFTTKLLAERSRADAPTT